MFVGRFSPFSCHIVKGLPWQAAFGSPCCRTGQIRRLLHHRHPRPMILDETPSLSSSPPTQQQRHPRDLLHPAMLCMAMVMVISSSSSSCKTAATSKTTESPVVTSCEDAKGSATTSNDSLSNATEPNKSKRRKKRKKKRNKELSGQEQSDETTTETDGPKRPLVVESDLVCCHAWISVFWNKRQQRIIYMLGTNHGQPYSVQLAGDLVRHVRPQAVFVELDYCRVEPHLIRFVPVVDHQNNHKPSPTEWLAPQSETLQDWLDCTNESTASTATPQIPTPRFSQMTLKPISAEFSAIAKRMYHAMDAAQSPDHHRPKSEFIHAIQQGHALGAAIVLGDRNYHISSALKEHATQIDGPMAAARAERVSPLSDAGSGRRDGEEEDDARLLYRDYDDVARRRRRNEVRQYNERFRQLAPANYHVQVAQRDAYMATGLLSLKQYSTIVAVMGKAHVLGVEQRLIENGWVRVPLMCRRHV